MGKKKYVHQQIQTMGKSWPEAQAPFQTSSTGRATNSDSPKHITLKANDTDGIFMIGSRKRPLEKVSFVFPSNGSSNQRPNLYQFGATREKYSNESLREPLGESIRNDIKKRQSIDEIFQKRKARHEESSHTNEPLEEEDQDEGIIDDEEEQPVVYPAGHLSGMSVEQVVRDKIGCRPRANSTDRELKLPQRGLCDERSVLQNYRWKSPLIRKKTPVGFANLGNTCFLNSTLQCLSYLPPFCQSIMDMHESFFSESSNRSKLSRKVTMLLCRMFRQVHGSTQDSTFAPRGLVKALSSLGSGGGRSSGYKFRAGRQEDAHEFLVHLLDSMHDGELREAGIDQRKSGWRDRLPIPRLDETTFVHRIFGGYLRSQVKCTNCDYCSNTYDPFLDLNLEVSKKNCDSIKTAFAKYTRSETLDSENKWKCSKCKQRVCAKKQLTVFRPPLSLCIQLKRFTYGSMSFGSSFAFGGRHGGGGGKKITKPIEFKAHMKLPLSDSRSCSYALTGIVVHVGGSASSGHYTAFVKTSNQWYLMDDSYVQRVSESMVLKQRDAYLLFYSRQEVALEFPNPPLKGLPREQVQTVGKTHQRSRLDSHEALDSLATITMPSPKATATPSAVVQQSPSDVKHPVSRMNHTSLSDSICRKSQEDEKSTDISQGSPVSMYPDQSMSATATGLQRPDDDNSQSVRGIHSSPRSGPAEEIRPTSESSTKERESPSKDATSKPLVKVVLDHGPGRGKVERIIRGPRSVEKTWKPKTVLRGQGDKYNLLGNEAISSWGDGGDDHEERTADISRRSKVAKQIETAETYRKRKMFMSRWDQGLDQGKVRLYCDLDYFLIFSLNLASQKKKIKSKASDIPEVRKHVSGDFQRIQSSVQSMNRKAAKGFIRQKLNFKRMAGKYPKKRR